MITDYPSVEARFISMGASMPEEAVVLPRNFESATTLDAWVYEAITPNLSILARQAGLVLNVPGPQPPRTINEYSAETVSAALHIGSLILSDTIAISLVKFFVALAKYTRQRWGTTKSIETSAVQELIVSKNGKSKRIVYRGPIDGLPQIVDIAKDLFRSE